MLSRRLAWRCQGDWLLVLPSLAVLICTASQMTKPAETVVAISVSSDGIKVVEALTSEILSNVFIKNIA